MKRIDLYFDYASPWAYLASELAARDLAGADIDHRPISVQLANGRAPT